MDEQADIKTDTRTRHLVLRELIREGAAGTQVELCEALRQRNFDVTQSTVSRDLRRIGAIKTTNAEGEIIYRMPGDQVPQPLISPDLGDLVTEIQANENMIVLHTTPGSASLVARHLDHHRTRLGILGTLAGDDAIFIVPVSVKKITEVIQKIKEEF